MNSAERAGHLAEMAQFRREWRGGEWKKRQLIEQIGKMEWWEGMVVRYPYKVKEDLVIAEELRGMIESREQALLSAGMAENPIAFFKPSWAQAQILNAWSPQFEPDKAPGGYRTICDWSAVRSGKTTVEIINLLAWLLPNDPAWMMFEPYVDFKGRTVQVLQRPKWDYWIRTGRMIYDAAEPPKNTCENWHGCPDEMHWKEKVDREYRKWMPMSAVAKRGKDIAWNITDRWIETKWGSRINGKLYMSDMQAWSGKELFITNFDEGPPKDKLSEVRIRTAYIYWAFTPREPANTGAKTRVAYEVYKERYPLLPPQKSFVFGWDEVPEHIMPAERKKIRLAMMREGNQEDDVTSKGGFYFSSPLVFESFDRERHILPITGEVAIRAMRGESTPEESTRMPWLEKFREANIIRGFDEGTVHPTACSWLALLRTGEKVMFREYCASAHSIRERVENVVRMSGNELELVRSADGRTISMELSEQYAPELYRDAQREAATGVKTPRYREKFVQMRIRKTFADSKMWKTDPAHPMEDFTQNYARAGLRMQRASNALPQVRCDWVNGLFAPDRTRRHLNPAQDNPDDIRGYGLYITLDCEKTIERLESYMWEQVQAGPRVGEFTGKPEARNDDLVDSLCYAAIERMSWISDATLDARRMGRAA